VPDQQPRVTPTAGAQTPSGAAPAPGGPTRRADPRRIVARPVFDMGSGIGLIGAGVIIATAVWLGGSAAAFLDLPSSLIVLGGTAATTLVSFPLMDVLRVPRQVLEAILRRPANPAILAREVLRLAEQARQTGPLGLEEMLPKIRSNEFLHQAVGMIVDGMPSDQIERTLASELASHSRSARKASDIMRRAGEVAPAMGLIGTLVGLVQMLGHLDDPTAIGPAMAVALLTTFYGAILANVVFLPLAGKLDRNAEDEILLHQIYTAGAASIARQENPRRLELVINTILPPGSRIHYFD
jgi:chemotaxis protein MotA